MTDVFHYDVFLSHSAKDRAVAREVAERLRMNGLRVWFHEWMLRRGDSVSTKIEQGLERSRVLLLFMSANTFGSEWVELEATTFRFRDPLNRDRRFLPLRLDDAPIRGSLARFPYVSWLASDRAQVYQELLDICRASTLDPSPKLAKVKERVVRFDGSKRMTSCSFSHDATRMFAGFSNESMELFEVESGRRIHEFIGDRGNPFKENRHAVEKIDVSRDGRLCLTWCADGTARLWDVQVGHCFKKLTATHGVALTEDGRYVAILTQESTLTAQSLVFWDATRKGPRDSAFCLTRFHGACHLVLSPDRSRAVIGREHSHVLTVAMTSNIRTGTDLIGHSQSILAIAWSPDGRYIVTGSSDGTIRQWEVSSGRCLRTLEGHAGDVRSVAWHADGRHILSGGSDRSVRLWDTELGRCLNVITSHADEVIHVTWTTDGDHSISCDEDGVIRISDVTGIFIAIGPDRLRQSPFITAQVEYTNAKILVVGESGAGKTGLSKRLALNEWHPSDSTVGAWATHWNVPVNSGNEVEREIWLWDFGGQADQRLIHQLYMDEAALILLLFNSDDEDVLAGLRDWLTTLQRWVKRSVPRFIVAGRVDTGFRASRAKLLAFAKEQGLDYHETSAKSGEGCGGLRDAMIAGVSWTQMEKRTSPRIFKLIKDEILKLRDEGQVLHTFKELRELLRRRLPNEPGFTDDTLQTVIGLLDSPGVVKELDYGTYILLKPEWINAYAQAVIRTLRRVQNDLGVLPLRSISEGKLIYQSIGRDGKSVDMKRLPRAEERIVLGEMERQLEQRGLCLRQGDKLVFPSHCGRDRPKVEEHPSVFVSYVVKGFLDDVYATLVVSLADCRSFQLKELWRDAADFVTLVGDHHMGLKLIRASGSEGEISVYFGKGVTQQEQVIFANYIHAHLGDKCEQAVRLRHYVCPNCHTPKGNREVLMNKLLTKKQAADTECDGCGERFPLWDALERKFASDTLRRQVEVLQADDLAKLDSRRKAKLLVLDVGARITSANQKWYEIPQEEDDGIDIVVEFTDEDGNGVGKGLCLQLKAGNSHLTKRKVDGVELFAIKKQRWVKTWMNQPHPVMLVIGTFSVEDERSLGKERVEFADVRWMEISSVLKRESQNGTKHVRQIEFKGERMDLTSVRRWRERLMTFNVT
jgi:small GTP-binding protein